mmetsp:Transcript_3823/g.6731  ORF Transcript_3823/g.6731 Transcript_3823/m.6731 type:complete len:222 (-) Transcript_3823:936-1601(-)
MGCERSCRSWSLTTPWPRRQGSSSCRSLRQSVRTCVGVSQSWRQPARLVGRTVKHCRPSARSCRRSWRRRWRRVARSWRSGGIQSERWIASCVTCRPKPGESHRGLRTRSRPSPYHSRFPIPLRPLSQIGCSPGRPGTWHLTGSRLGPRLGPPAHSLWPGGTASGSLPRPGSCSASSCVFFFCPSACPAQAATSLRTLPRGCSSSRHWLLPRPTSTAVCNI